MGASDVFDTPPERTPNGDESGVESAELTYLPEGDEPPTPVEEALAAHESRLLATDGVEGVGFGQNEIGDDAIIVYVRDRSVADALPDTIDGFPVVAEPTGPIDAY